MKVLKTRKWIVALLALLLVASMTGCKSESSPTAPSGNGGSGGGGGTTTPPSGATLTLAVSSANPVIDSSSVVTATVTQNNAAVPNGTAVEFQTDFGTFVVPGATSDVRTLLKTTTNGVATATISSSTAGTANITATVNNVTKSTKVNFVNATVTPNPPSTAPTVTGVTPSVGSPNGGQIVTISGTNFREPLKVLFDPGNGASPIEVPAIAPTSNSVQTITPKVNLAAGQQQKFGIIVITQQGSPNEQRATLAAAYTYQLDVLTPAPTTASPASGSINGGTRVTIFGSGFEENGLVQVFFGIAEAQVVKINFDQIIVISPPARTTGSPTGAVDIKITNVKSVKTATLPAGFRYVEPMSVTAMGPTQGPITGGTRVTIDGSGFDPGAGVAVVIGGIGAQPVFVSATRIIAVTGAPVPTGCSNVVGPSSVVNISNGDGADALQFTFVVQKPAILSVTNPMTAGANATVVVLNSIGTPRIEINQQGVPITGVVDNGDGTKTFTIVVPTSLTFNQLACATAPGVSANQTTPFDITYTNVETTCADTLKKGAVVNPTGAALAFSPATGFTAFTTVLAQVGPPATTGTPAPGQTVIFTNSGANPITINSATLGASPGCLNFNLNAPTTPFTINTCEPFPVTLNYTRNTPGFDTCSLIVTSTAGNRTLTFSGSAQ
jgi:hypothetical protein